MNILIIENVSMGEAHYGFLDKTLLTMFSVLPTLYARRVYAITPKKHRVEILNERYGYIDFDKPYDIVHINFASSSTQRAYEIADAFKKKGVTVVLSGLHASALPDEAKQHADSILLGPGELNWLRLLDDFEKKELQPIYYPEKYDDSHPIPPTNISLPGLVVSGAIEATRGCPYHCLFCREGQLPGGSQFYKRPLNEVINEIKNLPQKTFTFYDTSLTIDPSYTKALFTQMKPLHKKFSCNGNVDILAHDKELVRLSKEAGCVSWLIGFESVSQRTLDDIGKKTNTVTDYQQAVQNIHDNHMLVIGCFVLGFDTDTPAIFDETLRIVKDLKIDIVDFLVFTPFPGTPLYEKLNCEGRIITKNWSQYTMKNVVFTPKNMTSEELLQGIKSLYRFFYSGPYALQRIFYGMRFGLYPFFLLLERNLSAFVQMRLLNYSK
ncbi:MAG: B12-binding domain-containing radical SAM protein [Candidatus Thermoplasmatota archaeon]|nr:B12-binding domain-containing radical SAM protein [Candidatus Thermoplasmatota archaeon]